MENRSLKKVLVVGAGFGGVSAALHLAKKNIPDLKITLVSPSVHFEYHAGLYRVMTGRSPLEVCVPLRDIFDKTNVEIFQDTLIDVNFKKNTATGRDGVLYHFDYLILALGTETAYYDIPGLSELSFSLKSINDAVRLNEHLHKSFSECAVIKDKADKMCNTHIVIIGGGATGCEMAGELAVYTKKLAKKHGLEESMVTIDLITSSSALVPGISSEFSERIKDKLHNLGVNIYLNRRVMKEELETVYLRDVELKAKTVIWAAGTAGNFFYRDAELPVDTKGKVIVDEYLRSPSFGNVFIIGDGAATKFSGMAQTAVYDGEFVAQNIAKELTDRKVVSYEPRPVDYFIPVGTNWAAANAGGKKYFGQWGWFLRRLADFKFFRSILPLSKAITAFRADGILWDNCPVCSKSQLA
jgi:NADH dehydrogenase